MTNFKILLYSTIVVSIMVIIFSIVLTKTKGFGIDYKFRDLFSNPKFSDFKKVMNKATILANVETIFIMGFPIVFFLTVDGDYSRATSIIISVISSVGISQLLKAIFRVKRPTESQEYEYIGYSYPSGHSTVGMSFYLTVTSLMTSNVYEFKMIFLIGLMLGIAIGISRIVLGVHWFTDVIVGLTLGLFCSFWSVYLYSIGYYFKWLFM